MPQLRYGDFTTFDALTREIYILAGDDVELVIDPDGNWKFLNETSF